MGTARPPAHDRAGAALSQPRAPEFPTDSPLDHFEAVTDLDVLALSTPLGVFRSTSAEGIVWVNHRFLEIVGLSQDQVLGGDWVRAVHPLDRPRIQEARREFYAEPGDIVLAFRVVRTDGSVRHVRARVLPSAARPDEPTVFVGAIEDVTDRVGELSSTPSGPDPFRSLVAASALGVIYSDVTGRVTYVNQPWLDICGIRAEDILGTDDLRVAHPDDRVAIFESMSAASAAGEEWFGEMRVLRPDGGVRHTRTSLAAIRDAGGSITGYVGTLEDVTDEAADRQKAELALKARVAAEALVAETSRTLVTASVDDVDDRVITVLERLARFVGADAAVLAARMSELKEGSIRQHAWYAPEVGEPSPGTDADWVTGVEESIGSVTLSWRQGQPSGSRRGARAARGRRRRTHLDAGARPRGSRGPQQRRAVPLAGGALVGLHAGLRRVRRHQVPQPGHRAVLEPSGRLELQRSRDRASRGRRPRRPRLRTAAPERSRGELRAVRGADPGRQRRVPLARDDRDEPLRRRCRRRDRHQRA